MDEFATPQLAVVTGASSGIGYEPARQFTRNGFGLYIAAADAELATAAEERAAGTDIDAIQVDLATPHGVASLDARIEPTGPPVDALALNAGVAAGGSFAGLGDNRTSLDDERRIVDLDVRSTAHLAKLVIGTWRRAMRARILFTSPIASTISGAFQAVYNAPKVRAVLRAGVAQRAQGGRRRGGLGRMLPDGQGRDAPQDCRARLGEEVEGASMLGIV